LSSKDILIRHKEYLRHWFAKCLRYARKLGVFPIGDRYRSLPSGSEGRREVTIGKWRKSGKDFADSGLYELIVILLYVIIS
jgi:hypothetical protein